MTSVLEMRERLTGPGAPFEIVEETVLGERMQVFKNRARSLRELLEQSGAHADQEYLVEGERRIRYGEHLAPATASRRAIASRSWPRTASSGRSRSGPR